MDPSEKVTNEDLLKMLVSGSNSDLLNVKDSNAIFRQVLSLPSGQSVATPDDSGMEPCSALQSKIRKISVILDLIVDGDS